MSTDKTKHRYFAFLLTALIIVLDQLSKQWIVKNIPQNTIGYSFFGDFLWIVHVRNTGVAFSLGAQTASVFRFICFIVLPIAFMAVIAFFIAKKDSIFSDAQRWYAAGILGGGIGTIIDRVFRFNEGVVDFISVKFYGIFGLERWPTFNVSDSCVVIFVILFAISVLFVKDQKNG